MRFYKKKVLVVVDWENLRKSLEKNPKSEKNPGKRLDVNYNYPDKVHELIQSFIEEDEETFRILFYHALLHEKYRPPINEFEEDQLLKELESKGIFNKKYLLEVRERNFVSYLREGNKIEKFIYPHKKIPWDKIKPSKEVKSTENNRRYSIKRISSYHFIEKLNSLNNVTCRLGYIALDKLDVHYKIINGKNKIGIAEKLKNELDKETFKIFIPRQKKVDVLMGIDIVNYSLKRLVDKILIFCNDTDILPAIKEAKRNGVKVIIATFRENTDTVNKELIRHSDEIRIK